MTDKFNKFMTSAFKFLVLFVIFLFLLLINTKWYIKDNKVCAVMFEKVDFPILFTAEKLDDKGNVIPKPTRINFER